MKFKVLLKLKLMATESSLDQKELFLKGGIILVVILLLLIPISMVKSLITERSNSKEQVLRDLGLKWGYEQQIKGPFLVVPFEDEKTKDIAYAYFLAEDLKIEGDILPETRSRGMYEALCYQSKLKFEGKFTFPNVSKLNIKEEQVDWSKAFFVINMSNISTIKNELIFNVNGKPFDVTTSSSKSLNAPGLVVDFPLNPENRDVVYDFQFKLDLNGMDTLSFTPVGQHTVLDLKSSWKTVSFTGDFLPDTREITDNGFVAKWEIFDKNDSYRDATIGVSLLMPVDNYQKIMRSVKYAMLFIALTFMAFFLIEILSKKRIHPIQYVLVSFALIMFYALLLSISEYIGFDWAYLISAIAVVTMITTYTRSVLKNNKQVLGFSVFLSCLYLFLYVVIQLETMSLLFGSIGLFVMLGGVMYMSRKIDWYNLKKS